MKSIFVTLMTFIVAALFVSCGGTPAPNNTSRATNTITAANSAAPVNVAPSVNTSPANNSAAKPPANMKSPVPGQKMTGNAKIDQMASDDIPPPEAKKKR